MRKASISIQQGLNTINVAPYLDAGVHQVKIRVENSEGITKSINYSITVIALSLTTTNTEYTVASTPQILYVVPTGSGTKTIHYVMDGTEIGSEETEVSGRSISFVVPVQSHGAHILQVYATATINGTTVTSDPLRLAYLFVDNQSTVPIISSTFDTSTASEGETLIIPYMIYNPVSESTNVTLSVIAADNSIYHTETLTAIDRNLHQWSIRDYPAGNIKFRISAGTQHLDLPVTVTESVVEINTITDGLIFDFDPIGRSNSQENPDTWSQGNITATFSGVGFAGADGWLTDTEGTPILRILPGGEVTITEKIFNQDRRENGLTIEAEIASHNVRDYDSLIMTSLSNNRGFKIASQYAELISEQSSISMQFKEDEKVRVAFVIEPQNLNRLLYVYINGIMCGTIQYPVNDNFEQSPAANITIGAESSGIDIYRILVYEKGLNRNEILDNYIAGRGTLTARLDAYNRNNLLNEQEEIAISRLPVTLPYMIISCDELPQFKGDKKTCAITYVNQSDPSKSFTAEGV